MCCYAERIRWVRSELKVATEKQVREKAELRKPHESIENASYLQYTTIERSYKITALLTLLNRYRNMVGPYRSNSHEVNDKWARGRVSSYIHKLTTKLDEVHPYPKLYVIVDKSLSPVQKGIQGAHAVAELFSQYGVRDHSALIFLESSMSYGFTGVLGKEGVKTACFHEPSWNNKLTAIAIEPIEESKIPEQIRDLPLAG